MIASIVIGRGNRRQQFDVPRDRNKRHMVSRILKNHLFNGKKS